MTNLTSREKVNLGREFTREEIEELIDELEEYQEGEEKNSRLIGVVDDALAELDNLEKKLKSMIQDHKRSAVLAKVVEIKGILKDERLRSHDLGRA